MATCLDYSLKYIHIYPKTEQELRTKLFTKKYTEQEIHYTMEFLKKKGYIDDRQFTQLYIQSELVKKGKIPALVRAKLIHKWVSKVIIDELLLEKEEDIEQGVHERIRKEVEKRKNKWLDWYDIMVKIAQKWYKISDIKKALKNKEE